jgi:hypothetical protein
MAATDSIANMNTTPMAAATMDTVRLCANAAISGGAGAVVATYGDRGVTVVQGAAGTYNVTYPKIPGPATGAAATRFQMHVTVQSAALTIASVIVTAGAPTSGTATFKTLNAAGAAANPADGDVLMVQIFASRSKAVL